MESREQTIKALKSFFTLSCAGFEFMNTIHSVTGKSLPLKQQEMWDLHKVAVMELNKENPSPEVLDRLLEMMENKASESITSPTK